MGPKTAFGVRLSLKGGGDLKDLQPGGEEKMFDLSKSLRSERTEVRGLQVQCNVSKGLTEAEAAKDLMKLAVTVLAPVLQDKSKDLVEAEGDILVGSEFAEMVSDRGSADLEKAIGAEDPSETMKAVRLIWEDISDEEVRKDLQEFARENA